jgi:hypothetical protein
MAIGEIQCGLEFSGRAVGGFSAVFFKANLQAHA